MPAQDLEITPTLTLPATDLELAFSRASGPGGQNVNKVNSRVELRFAVVACTALEPEVKARLMSLARRRISREGILTVASQRFRDQGRNLGDCYQKLRELVLQALEVPTARVETQPSRRVKARRVADKRHRAQIKSTRRPAGGDD